MHRLFNRLDQLNKRILSFEAKVGGLPGLPTADHRSVLVQQLQDSCRRVQGVRLMSTRDISDKRLDPRTVYFHPVRAAALSARKHDVEEAAWLVFLITHFGKHKRAGWALVRAVYGALESEKKWSWQRVKSDLPSFKQWLREHSGRLRRLGAFGNHRKYESLDAESDSGTFAVVSSYVELVEQSNGHTQMFTDALADGSKEVGFDRLYRKIRTVHRFGRTASFDYLTMIGNTMVAPIAPGSLYLEGATGPLRGAQLLFGKSTFANRERLEEACVNLAKHLSVGCQELEDALCNWQKNPKNYKYFAA